MRTAIIGFGREGQSILRFLKKRGGRGRLSILDRNTRLARPSGVEVQLGKDYLAHLEEFNLVYRSPGIPWTTPALVRARKKGVRFSSATRLFFEETRNITKNIVGITGTKGKGTTATLLYQILKRAGKEVFLVGNIGKPALDALPKLTKRSWIILELSSFQLQDLDRSPHIAVIVETFPDHQDHHASLNEYYGAKSNITRHQKPGDSSFFFGDNSQSRRIGLKGRGKKHAVTEKGFALFRKTDLLVPGKHNFKNAVMAATIARSLGISPQIIRRTLRTFKGTEHRLEFVRKVMVQQDRHENKVALYFYNDSASTNPHTTAAATRAFPAKAKVLIAGGQDKKLDYAPLRAALREERKDVQSVVLVGENKRKIAKAIKAAGVPYRYTPTLNAAVGQALADARATKHEVVIIFSPGATSFDMFNNYAERGRVFKQLVKHLRQ